MSSAKWPHDSGNGLVLRESMTPMSGAEMFLVLAACAYIVWAKDPAG